MGKEVSIPVEIHPAMSCTKNERGTFVAIEEDGVQLLTLKGAMDGNGIILRLIKVDEDNRKTTVRFPDKIKTAAIVNSLEEFVKELEIKENELKIDLIPNRITQILITYFND